MITIMKRTVEQLCTFIWIQGNQKRYITGLEYDAVHNLYNTTGICNTCPPYAPKNLKATIVGQNVELSWDSYTDYSAYGLQVVKNGSNIGSFLSISATSYSDNNAISSFPATYSVYAFNRYGSSYSSPIKISVSQSNISYNTTWSGVVYSNCN